MTRRIKVPQRLNNLIRHMFYPERVRAQREAEAKRRLEEWNTEMLRHAQSWRYFNKQIQKYGSVTIDDAGRVFDPLRKSDDN